jgi:DNA-binding GntR family transcriptional regulator
VSDPIPHAAAPRGDGQHVEEVHERLRQAILRGGIAPGDELSQVRLARELGVSRTPLREALRMLRNEGLVVGAPNQQLRVAGFSVADMEEIYVERIALESVAVRIAIPRLSREGVGALEGLLATMAHFQAEEDYERWEVPHRALHAALVRPAGPRLAALTTQLSEHAERYRRTYTTKVPRAWSTGASEHRAIVDAAKAGDAVAGARALAEHLAGTARAVIDLVEPAFVPTALDAALAGVPCPGR